MIASRLSAWQIGTSFVPRTQGGTHSPAGNHSQGITSANPEIQRPPSSPESPHASRSRCQTKIPVVPCLPKVAFSATSGHIISALVPSHWAFDTAALLAQAPELAARLWSWGFS